MRFGFCSSLAAATFIVTSLISTDPVAAAPTAHVLRFATAEEVATLNPDINQQAVVNYLELDDRCVRVPTRPREQADSRTRNGDTDHAQRGHQCGWKDDHASLAPEREMVGRRAVRCRRRRVHDFRPQQSSERRPLARPASIRSTHIDEPNKYTAIFHLKAPFGAIVPTLFASNGGTAILPKHLLAGLHDMNEVPFNSLPVGIGPFRYVAWKRGDEIELERNPYYWRGAPALERVIMKLVPDRNTVLTELQTGELDLWYPFGGSFLSRVQAIPGVHVIRQAGYGLNQFMLNTSHPVLADVAVRQALRLGSTARPFSKKRRTASGSCKTHRFRRSIRRPRKTSRTSRTTRRRRTRFSMPRAGSSARTAFVRRTACGSRSTLRVARGSPDVDTQIELLRSQWAKIGVDLQVQRYTSALLFGPIDQGGILNNGKFDVLLLGTGYPRSV